MGDTAWTEKLKHLSFNVNFIGEPSFDLDSVADEMHITADFIAMYTPGF